MATSFGKTAPTSGGDTVGNVKAPKMAPAPAPIKQAPQTGSFSGSVQPVAPGRMPPQQAQPEVDEFGRSLAAMGGLKNPLAAVGDFNQRKANAQAFSAPPAPQMGPMGGTGGGFMAPGPPQPAQGPGRLPPQPMDPYDPQGGFGAGAGQGMFRGVGQQQPPPPQPGGFQPPPQLQQMLQQPGFMQWLMRMFQNQQGGGGQAIQPGQPPQPSFQPANQGPPR